MFRALVHVWVQSLALQNKSTQKTPVLPASLKADAGDRLGPATEANLSNTVLIHLKRKADRQKSSWWVLSKPPQLASISSPLSQEIGDVENWARSIELDMRTIATALEYVYKGQLQSAPS